MPAWYSEPSNGGCISRARPTDTELRTSTAHRCLRELPLSATGWKITRDAAGKPAPVAGRNPSWTWDGNGGRHCPSHVKGWDPAKSEWVERIYYAGAADNLWGPYTIGFLQWDGDKWIDQPEPAFAANEDWEHGSVYEPNLIYHDGKWKMWYVAGSNQEDYLVHGYAESEDGCTGWSKHAVFAPPEMKMFDFCVRQRGGHIRRDIRPRLGRRRHAAARDWIVVVQSRQAVGYTLGLESAGPDHDG